MSGSNLSFWVRGGVTLKFPANLQACVRHSCGESTWSWGEHANATQKGLFSKKGSNPEASCWGGCENHTEADEVLWRSPRILGNNDPISERWRSGNREQVLLGVLSVLFCLNQGFSCKWIKMLLFFMFWGFFQGNFKKSTILFPTCGEILDRRGPSSGHGCQTMIEKLEIWN